MHVQGDHKKEAGDEVEGREEVEKIVEEFEDIEKSGKG